MKKFTSSLTSAFIIVIVVVAGIVFVGGLYSGLRTSQADIDISDASEDSRFITNATSSAPSRIMIPKIGVDAHVQHVGISKRGTIAVPSNYKDVAWYKRSPAPGSPGIAIIDGHLDNGFGLPAVFRDIQLLNAGDSVIIQDVGGRRYTFEVTESSSLPSDANTESLFSKTGIPRLVLITCEGTWDPATKMYSDRRIIYASLVSVE